MRTKIAKRVMVWIKKSVMEVREHNERPLSELDGLGDSGEGKE